MHGAQEPRPPGARARCRRAEGPPSHRARPLSRERLRGADGGARAAGQPGGGPSSLREPSGLATRRARRGTIPRGPTDAPALAQPGLRFLTVPRRVLLGRTSVVPENVVVPGPELLKERREDRDALPRHGPCTS